MVARTHLHITLHTHIATLLLLFVVPSVDGAITTRQAVPTADTVHTAGVPPHSRCTAMQPINTAAAPGPTLPHFVWVRRFPTAGTVSGGLILPPTVFFVQVK